MKGLILKDLYMARKYCRSYVLLVVLFLAISLFGGEKLLFMYYPCMLCGMLPVTLLGYDEKSRWMQYSRTMPYTSAQIVSGKYLVGLLAQLAMVLISAVFQLVKTNINGSFVMSEYLTVMSLIIILSLISSSITLPFMFKFGVEKGRIAYYIMIGVACGGSIASYEAVPKISQSTVAVSAVLPVSVLVSAAIFALSWYLSIVFFRKREL